MYNLVTKSGITLKIDNKCPFCGHENGEHSDECFCHGMIEVEDS